MRMRTTSSGQSKSQLDTLENVRLLVTPFGQGNRLEIHFLYSWCGPTFVPYSVMGCSTTTDVSDEAIAPIRIEMITSPVSVHMIPNMRAEKERGHESPYL